MLMKYRVMGYTSGKGDYEGHHYDRTKLRVELPVPSSKKNERGTDRVEFVVGDAAHAERLEHIQFPCEMELDIQPTSTGNEIVEMKLPVKAGSVKAA